MGFYYYKDGEKIGPVDSTEFYNLLEWGDIKPDTIIEWPNGKQLPASENSTPPGSNPLNISLKTARRLAVAYERFKIRCIFVILILFAVTGAAAFTQNRVLMGVPFAGLIIATGVLISAAVFAHKTRIDKVPPKRDED